MTGVGITNWSVAGSALRNEAIALVVAREQVSENLRYARAASIAGVFNACVAVAVFWTVDRAPELIAWLAAIVLAGLLRLRNIRKHVQGPHTLEAIERRRHWIEFVAVMNGLIWGVGVAFGALVADPAQFVLVVILCSGMMGASVTTYTSMASGATLFLVPLAIGGLASLWLVDWAPSVVGTILMGSYLTLLIGGAIGRERRFIERVRGREEVRHNAQTIKLLLNDFASQSSDWLWQVDEEGQILDPSERFAQAASASIPLIDRREMASLFDLSSESARLRESIRSAAPFRDLTVRLTIGGEPRWWQLAGQPLPDGTMRGVASDVTARKRAELHAEDVAQKDTLTGLLNRQQFSTARTRNLARRSAVRQSALLLLDIEGFKRINETLGEAAGDAVLCEVAVLVSRCAGRFGTVARLGDDEFAMLLEGPASARDSKSIARAILSEIGDVRARMSAPLSLTVSIGIASAADGGVNGSTLLRHANAALQSARGMGRNTVAVCDVSGQGSVISAAA